MNLIKNIQAQQLLNLTLLILISYLNNKLQINLANLLPLLIFATATELTIKKELFIPYSALITVLGTILMVGWLAWYIPYILIFLALMQKQYLKIDNKHIFNPSNFAVIAALLIFYPKALPIIGEIGKESYIVYIVLFIGTLILIRVDRYLISISFLLSYIFLSWLIIGKSDPYWMLSHFLDSLYSTSFIVYILFMLTDPVTTPSKSLQQIIFGFTVATLVVALNYFIGVRLWHMFIALFLTSIVSIPIYRKLSTIDYKKFIYTLLFTLTILVIISLKTPHYFSM